tara:strand:- start:900 stop:1382 length:483 start_codon:yes stop_codon:yes gene_type:complete
MDNHFDSNPMYNNQYDPDGYDPNDYGPDDYDPNDYNYNGTGYGGTQFLLDSKICYLFIGAILYTSCCCLRNWSRIRDTDLITNINQNQSDNSKVISKIKKNIVSPKDIDKSSSCSICLEEFNSEKEIAFLDCKHMYHMDCIIEWIKNEVSCPLCRNSELV